MATLNCRFKLNKSAPTTLPHVRTTSLSEVVASPVLDDESLVISATDGLIITTAVRLFGVGVGIRPVKIAYNLVGLMG